MSEFQVTGSNADALFTLKIHRGDGMALVAMDWKDDEPPLDFVGFAIEYKEPNGNRFFALKNRIAFPGADGKTNPNRLSSMQSPIQKFRWVHFPRNAELAGEFVYRVTPVFMNKQDELSFGEQQVAAIELRRETYPDQLNVTYTRGFVLSQAFVDRYKTISKLLPAKAKDGLKFTPTHPKKNEALAWMGFEARSAILEVLDQAIKDEDAKVRVVAYDLSQIEVVSRLEKMGSRLKIIIDDAGEHGHADSGETQAARRLMKTAGEDNVKRQKMGALQHNKTIVVDGPNLKKAVCGSTNFSWRGLYVQSNNAVVLTGESAIKPFLDAFESYWENDEAADFGATGSAEWTSLGLRNINAEVSFSPHVSGNALLDSIAEDMKSAESSVLFSLAFLYQTEGSIREAVKKLAKAEGIFLYGISDKKVGGLDFQKPDGKVKPVFPSALSKNVPEPFKSEPKGGGGNRMHHKFVVIDFDKPTARVYFGSYNFSPPADTSNGENLLLIRDRRIAVSYMIEALRIFDHYHFRVVQAEAKNARKKLQLAKPPRKRGEKTWWSEYYTDERKIRDRKLFS
ncbi:phospholipase D-like domain-containing protein [Bradyrhizobium australiense]|uniref:Phospholipase D n=1 Tax=Bradyrhizobium australiense TaxID=2721161 RepID=A0A7Y4GZY0_9BRAD|nr:phospholipase D-like domain-containing protein [Bradyrhizobium australiense]NOJ44382.1 phospholipase [Bradyrhizobium australiense]